MSVMGKKNLSLNRINAALLALYPVLDIYSFADLPIGIGSVLLIISGFVSFFMTRPTINNKATVNWIIALMAISVVTLFFQGGESWYSTTIWWHNTIVTAYILFIFFTSANRIDIHTFFNVGILVSLIATIICFYQRFTLTLTGSFDKFFIPGLSIDEQFVEATIPRPSAFFTEPAHMSICVIPMFYYTLTHKQPIIALILALGVLATGSTTGFLLLGILFVLFVFSNMGKKSKLLYVGSFLIAGFLVIKYAPNLLQENLDKINKTEASDDIRLLGGVLFWRFFSLKEVVLGIGLNQLENFAQSFSFLTKNYSGSLVYTFTSFGLLGVTVTAIYFSSLFRKKYNSIGAILIFSGVFCTDQILFNRHLVYLLVFVECMRLLNFRQIQTY